MSTTFIMLAEELLNKRPDFFDLPLSTREAMYKKIKDEAKTLVTNRIESDFSSAGNIINMKKRLANLNKTDLKRAMKYLGIEKDPLKLAEEEGGLEQLELLIHVTENYERVVNGHIGLD